MLKYIGGITGVVMVAAFTANAAEAKAPEAKPVEGAPMLMTGAYDVATLGYTKDEYFVSGVANSFSAPQPLTPDGRWTASVSGTAPYRTRIVVMRPTDTAKFNGTVIVEWLNVSGGLDAPADWFMAHREIVRSGYAYVAVSAQKVGVEGGASLGADMSLKKINPTRYASLSHPGDAFAFDIFSQAGRLVRRARGKGILGPLIAKHVIAAGESQSAHFLTTYVNAIDPKAKVYDGFLIHSRFGGSAPLDGSSIIGGKISSYPQLVKFRPDLRVPLLTVITETDLVGTGRQGYYVARQPDAKNLRTWEIPGTAHADTYMLQVAPIDTGTAPIAAIAAAYKPSDNLMGMKVAKPINSGPQHHYVVQAAFAALNRWVATGKPAPAAQPISLTSDAPPALVIDAGGHAEGGIRTPWVDVPAKRLSGTGNGGNIMAALFGSSEPFDAQTLSRLYPGGKPEYLSRFKVSLDAAIDKGFLLSADREEILQLADAMYPTQP
jgi:Alpha/beta hydrolase domain